MNEVCGWLVTDVKVSPLEKDMLGYKQRTTEIQSRKEASVAHSWRPCVPDATVT